MHPVTYKSLTPEFKKNHTITGQSIKPILFTKSDFLTPAKVAEKFDLTTPQAQELLRILFVHRTVFGANGHKTQMVIRVGKSSGYSLHPLACDAFRDFLTKQKE